jgi:predicted Zn-dependent protease
MAFEEAEATRISQRVLAACKRAAPGAAIALRLRHRQCGQTRFACNEVSTAGDVERIDLTLSIAFGRRAAAGSLTQLDAASVEQTAARIARMARLSPEQPELMPLLAAQTYLRPKAASDAATRAATPELRARAAASAIARAKAGGLSIAGFYQHADESLSIANSAGLSGYHAWTSSQFDCTARTPDGSGSGWAGAHSQRASELEVDALAAIAVDKATRSRSPRPLAAGRYSVVLEPSAVAALLSVLSDALDARTADEGRSFFSKPGGGSRVGEKLFADGIALRTDPSAVALGVLPWGSESLPLRAASWIDNGTLQQLPYSRYWAQQKGVAAVPRPQALLLQGGASALPALIAGVKRGVLITHFWYLNYLDPRSLLSTGLTRDGTFLIENGEVVGPVNNFRFNESPHVMLKNCDGLSASVVAPDGSMRVPSLRTHDFNLASVSEAV